MTLSPLAKFKLAIESQMAEDLHTQAKSKEDTHLIKLSKDLMDSRDLLKIAVIVALAGVALAIISEVFHIITIVGLVTAAYKAVHLYECVEQIHVHANDNPAAYIELGLHEITELFGFKVS